MFEHLDRIVHLLRAGQRVGFAIVTAAYHSSPRPVGASMLVESDGRVHGSVSGGCVEGAVFESSLEVLAGGKPRLERYGISDDDAFAVGLTCGGSIEVWVDVIDPADLAVMEEAQREVEADRPVAVIMRLGSSPAELAVVTPAGTSGQAEFVGGDLHQIVTLLETAESKSFSLTGGGTAFAAVWRPRPRMVLVGSTQIVAELARQGNWLGYRVTVCDARANFATPERFPDADEVVIDWPHRYLQAQAELGHLDSTTVVCVLAHDTKFEVPLLRYLLTQRAGNAAPGFIGVMGSRRAHEDRTARLLAEGVTKAQLSTLASPFGLDLGGRSPAETALSMAAQVVAWNRGGSGAPLSELSGDIHRPTTRAVIRA